MKAGSQIEDQASIHLFIEVEVEVVERFLRITKLRLFSFARVVVRCDEFVTHQAGNKIERRTSCRF
jgi:hypothetical protein